MKKTKDLIRYNPVIPPSKEKSEFLNEVNKKSLLEHYRITGRTPLSIPSYHKYNHKELNKIQQIWDEKFHQFQELLNQAEGKEREKLINNGIGILERIVKRNSDFEIQHFFKKLIDELKDFKKSDCPNRILAIYIVIAKELKLLPNRLSKNDLVQVINKVGSRSTANTIRKEISICFNGNRDEIKSYLDKQPYNDGRTGYDILKEMPESNQIIKYIQNNW